MRWCEKYRGRIDIDIFVSPVGCKLLMSEGRVHTWMSLQLIAGGVWAFGSVQECPEGVLAPLPAVLLLPPTYRRATLISLSCSVKPNRTSGKVTA